MAPASSSRSVSDLCACVGKRDTTATGEIGNSATNKWRTFRSWRHTHRFEPIATEQSLYEDRVEYAVPGGRLAQLLAAPVLRSLLTRTFARRHRIVRAAVAPSVSRDRV